MPRRRPPMPADFPQFAGREGNLRLRKRFKVGGATIELWRRQLGVRYNPPMPAKMVSKVTMRRRVKRFARMADEQIEDMCDFGTDDIARSLDLRSFDMDW